MTLAVKREKEKVVGAIMYDLMRLLGQYIYNEIGVNHNSEYIIGIVDAKNLIKEKRIDLLAKYILVESIDKQISSSIPMDIYVSHLKAFNDGKISEPGNAEKNSLKDYLDVFYKLIDEIKQDKFDATKSIIPVDSNGVIFDGAHRVSVSAYYNKKLPVVYFPNAKAPINDYEYFLKRGMKEEYLDLLVLKYCELTNKNIYLCCVWPICYKYHKTKEIDLLIRNYVDIVYKKEIKFNYNGLKNFQVLAYDQQEWIGNINNHFSGINGKVNYCYYNANTLFYIIEADDDKCILELKERIREIVGIGKHAVHITDSNQETLYLIRHILNPNTVLYINSYEPFFNEELMTIVSGEVSDQPFDTSFTLVLHGISANRIKKVNKKAEIDRFDFIYDYRNYIYFRGFKFISKECCKMIDPENINVFNTIKYKSTNSRFKNIKGDLCTIVYRVKARIIKSIVESELYRIVRPYYKRVIGRFKR